MTPFCTCSFCSGLKVWLSLWLLLEVSVTEFTELGGSTFILPFLILEGDDKGPEIPKLSAVDQKQRCLLRLGLATQSRLA